MGTRRAVKACYFVVWNSLTPVLSLGIAAYAGLPVFLGAGGAAGLAQDGMIAAAFAEAEFLGFSPVFLCVEAMVLLAFLGLVSLPLVLEAFLALRFHFGWGQFSAVPGLRCFWCGLLSRFRHRGCLWWLSGWLLGFWATLVLR